MRRSDRASTVKNSQELQSKLASREIKSNLRKSRRSLPVSEAIELSSDREVDTSAKDTSSEEDQVFREEEEYWEDSSAYRFTDPELVLSDSPFLQPPSDSSRWSTSVNQFGLDTSQTLAIDSNSGNVNTVEDLQLDSSKSVSPNSSLQTVREMAMNDQDYNAKYMAIDDQTVNIESLIAYYNENTVTLLDLGTYREELQNIFASFTTFERLYLELRGMLNRDDETDVLGLTTLKELR